MEMRMCRLDISLRTNLWIDLNVSWEGACCACRSSVGKYPRVRADRVIHLKYTCLDPYAEDAVLCWNCLRKGQADVLKSLQQWDDRWLIRCFASVRQWPFHNSRRAKARRVILAQAWQKQWIAASQ